MAGAAGTETPPALLAPARAIAREGGVDDKVRFIEGDFFEADLREATVVTLYLSTTTNRRLASKLHAELAPGSRVVSQQFDMGAWEPDRRTRVADADLFLWVIPNRKGSHGSEFKVDSSKFKSQKPRMRPSCNFVTLNFELPCVLIPREAC